MTNVQAAAVTAAAGLLAKDLTNDVDKNDVQGFHNHAYNAILHGLSENDLRAAIRTGQDKLKAAWDKEQIGKQGKETNPWPGIEAFADHELDQINMRASFEKLIGSLDDDDDESGIFGLGDDGKFLMDDQDD